MATTYLTRTPSSAGNRKTWTASVWLKGQPSTTINNIAGQAVYSAGSAATDRTHFYFTNGIFELRTEIGNTQQIITTNQVFTDPASWYHFVVAVDSTQSTDTNRVKFFVNGVQITSFSAAAYLAQNADTYVNHTVIQTIGKSSWSDASYFNGQMSHFHMVDGTAYDASAFGSTDATTGEWTINTSPSVTYGTNGFTILKDGNTITDQSSNSNNWTLGGGTLTNTEDCPDNVFATLNPLMALGSNIAYSNGNLTITPGTSDYKTTASTIAVSSGKFYTEFKAVSGHNGSTDVSIGIVGADTFLASTGSKAMSAYTNAFSYGSGGLVKQYNGSTIRTDATYTNGDIIGIAVDMDNLKLYWSKNGTFQNSGNPASGSTGTGAVSITAGQPYYICAATISSGGVKVFSANFGNGYFGTTAVASEGTNASGNGIFEYDVPTGYTALSTKGLNI